MAALTGLTTGARIEKFIATYQWLCRSAGEKTLSRANLHFTAMHPFASAMTIVDVTDPGRWTVRLCGTATCDRCGSDRTGSDALGSFTASERELRLALIDGVFDYSCGIRATVRESYAGGVHALLDTIALPLVGPNGERMIVHYAQVVKDFEHAYGARPTAGRSDLLTFDYIDLGHGRPGDMPEKELRFA